ncbi:ABC transporter permease [Methanosarcinales archaeon]|nr:MAG: ABC transporter permease [Methanosarcinales archaeon]
MKLARAFKHALNLVMHSKLRSWLTIIGIVIGVASVVSIMSIGAGLEQDITSQLGGLGADLLTITPGLSKASGFSHKMPSDGGSATEGEVVLDRTDVQVLKGIPEILLIDTEIRGSAEVYYLGKRGSVTLTGVDQKVWAQITTSEMRDGRILGPADQNVIVIGGRLADDYFERPLGINKMITIEGSSFRVVGILDDQSTNIYMPIQMAYHVLDDKENDVYDSITVKIKNEDKLDYVIETIEHKLMMTRHVTDRDKDFTISSSRQMGEMKSEMVSSLTTFLTAIAAVALLVGAVGIANTMFTSVLEKTKEIGIMKALGARNKDILAIFLLNAFLIGLIGGIIGIILGYLLSSILPTLMGGGGFIGRLASAGSVVTLESVLLSLSVAVGIGTLSGAIPAYQASKLKPVDALRYE